MNLAAILLVTVVVWAISLIRSVRMRAFVYSLPLPMTLALATTEFSVDGAQVLGVVGLNLFFLTVTVLYHQLGWPIAVSDVLGIAVYVATSALLLVAAPVPFVPALIGTLVLWGAVILVLRRRRVVPSPVDATQDGLPALAKLLVIFVGAILTVLFGQLLQGMVVTFPYSGVLVAIETRRNLVEFSRHFSRNSLALVAFMAGYYLLQNNQEVVALAGAWATFAVTAFLLHLPRLRTIRRGASAASRTGAPDSPPDRLPAEPTAKNRGQAGPPARTSQRTVPGVRSGFRDRPDPAAGDLPLVPRRALDGRDRP